jgi:DnaJ-class molecular chaperone
MSKEPCKDCGGEGEFYTHLGVRVCEACKGTGERTRDA